MFSRDNRHYRPIPRSINEAFGPYHKFTPVTVNRSRLAVIVGTIALGVAFGLLLGWRG